MANYSITTSTPVTAAGTGILNVNSDGIVSPKVFDLTVSSDATPAEQASEFLVARNSDEGTGGQSITPEALNPISAVAQSVGLGGAWATTEPTNVANSDLLRFAVHQKATFRWVSAPGSELVALNTDNNGILLETLTATASYALSATMLFAE